MLLFIYSMSRSVVVVHFAIGLNKVASYDVTPYLSDLLSVESSFIRYFFISRSMAHNK